MGFNIDPSLSGYTPERAKIFYQQLTDNLSSIPGVQSVGLASMRILENNEWDSSMTVEGYNPAKPEDRPEPFMNQISPNYFATLGVPIVLGRDFTVNDNREVKNGPQPDDWTPTTVMINEKFARRYLRRAESHRPPSGLRDRSRNAHRHGDHRRGERHQVHQPPRRNPGAGLRSVSRQLTSSAA